jgi:ATP-dependent Zn protease
MSLQGRSAAENAFEGARVMSDLVSLLLSWVPLLLLIGIFFWYSRKMQMRGRSGVSMIELYEQQLAETRRMNATLERIAASMEKS